MQKQTGVYSIMLQLTPVQPAELEEFRSIVEAYWQELMPHADVLKDANRRQRYFQECFIWHSTEPLRTRHPQWAVVEERWVGFVESTVDLDRKKATIEDFYILPAERRQGYGGAMVQALYQQLDSLGITLVELNVRRDNPNALAFWEAQGFRVASYVMRQYRDPGTGQSFIGALSSDFV